MAEKVTIGNCELWHGDSRDVLSMFNEFGSIVTDPPYPDYLVNEYKYDNDLLTDTIGKFECRQFVFWSAKADFPLDYSAIHVWHKTGAGDIASYERIFERFGEKSFLVFKGNAITNKTMARFAMDDFTGHPSQKPLSLLLKLCNKTNGTVCDPFMGSGTTGVACANLGKAFTGVERERKYFDIACERIARAQAQERLFA